MKELKEYRVWLLLAKRLQPSEAVERLRDESRQLVTDARQESRDRDIQAEKELNIVASPRWASGKENRTRFDVRSFENA